MRTQIPKISRSEFALFKKVVYEQAGIHLKDVKITLVENRLRKRILELGLKSYRKYYDRIVSDRMEMTLCIDAITTNETYFFREPKQWEYLKTHILPMMAEDKKSARLIKIWSAACSSGEEPYTIAIFLRENLKNFDSWTVSITASDINTTVLSKARGGTYNPYAVSKMQKFLISRYFDEGREKNEKTYHLKQDIRRMVRFKQHNLKMKFPLQKFDIIFCRNVMIYFDPESKGKVIQNLYESLYPGGYFFTGAAEGLMNMKTDFKLMTPSIYRKQMLG